MEDEPQEDEDDPLCRFMFLNETESQPKTRASISNDDIQYQLTKEFKYDELSVPNFIPNLANAIDEVWNRKLTSDKLKIRLNMFTHLSKHGNI